MKRIHNQIHNIRQSTYTEIQYFAKTSSLLINIFKYIHFFNLCTQIHVVCALSCRLFKASMHSAEEPSPKKRLKTKNMINLWIISMLLFLRQSITYYLYRIPYYKKMVHIPWIWQKNGLIPDTRYKIREFDPPQSP